MIMPAATFQPEIPNNRVEKMTKKGALNAPTAKILCKKLRAAGLLSDTSLTTLLLKLEILPRLMPVNRKPNINRTGFPVIIMMAKPTTTKLHRKMIAFFLPR